ncbi:hypothetical protein AX15_006105 [Amanita polypyramis BW_CC]|nr:hypothetical protein AX15_006105 [Amanita polypyramis BW_CC]
MGAGQSKHEKVFHNETPISFSQDVVNQLSDHIQSTNVVPERQSNLDAHIRSRIQAELEHLRKEEEHVRQEIESALEKENLDRERAMITSQEGEVATGAVKSSTVLFEDLEQIRSKVDRFHARKRLDFFPQVRSTNEALLSCYRNNRNKSLDCWHEVKLFKGAVTLVEQEHLKSF